VLLSGSNPRKSRPARLACPISKNIRNWTVLFLVHRCQISIGVGFPFSWCWSQCLLHLCFAVRSRKHFAHRAASCRFFTIAPFSGSIVSFKFKYSIMDKSSKLNIVLGGAWSETSENASQDIDRQKHYKALPKPRHIYEGSSSEDDDATMSRLSQRMDKPQNAQFADHPGQPAAAREPSTYPLASVVFLTFTRT
jgi:hypothetical protein